MASTNINSLYHVPVFLSYATPYNDLQAMFLERLICEIENQLLFNPRTLGRTDQYIEEPLPSIRRMILSSYGILSVGFRRVFVDSATSKPSTPIQQTFENFWLTSPYIQIEVSMAFQQGLPVMILVEEGVLNNSVFGGVLEQGAGPFNIVRFSTSSPEAIDAFFESVFFKETFIDWSGKVRSAYNLNTLPQFKY